MADCTNCKLKNASMEPVPYISHEADMARMERELREQREHYKRLIHWLCSIIIILSIGIIGMFIYEAQFVDEEWSFEAQTEDGGNAIANGNGEVYYYGESKVETP